jgi:hypothetical protein
MTQLQDDIKYGLSYENKLFDSIQKKYPNIKKTGFYYFVDYESDDCIIELKSRRCTSMQYSTTMMPRNKIDKMVNYGKKAILIFNFTDCVKYLQLSEEIVDKFECGMGGRRDRLYKEYKEYYYIPIELLKTFDIRIQ